MKIYRIYVSVVLSYVACYGVSKPHIFADSDELYCNVAVALCWHSLFRCVSSLILGIVVDKAVFGIETGVITITVVNLTGQLSVMAFVVGIMSVLN